jgi:hypothetical protein
MRDLLTKFLIESIRGCLCFIYSVLHSPMRLHGVVLNSLSTGTTLPLLVPLEDLERHVACIIIL